MIKRLFLVGLCIVLYIGSFSVEDIALSDLSAFVGLICVVSIVIWH